MNDLTPPPETKFICVVLDTNIWRSELMLRTPIGAAMLFAVKQIGAAIGLPEIVEKEITKVIAKTGSDAAAKISEHLRTIEALVGSRPNIELPTQGSFAASVQNRFAELEGLLLRMPFTLNHATSALDRVIQELPPNGPNHEEFKDSAIWEVVLDIARFRLVHSVTNDKGFFKDREPRNGPADNIAADIKREGGGIFVYNSLRSCLSILQKETPPVLAEPLAEAIETLIRPELVAIVSQRDFELGRMTHYSVEPFLTERIGVLALDFRLTHELDDRSPDASTTRKEATVVTTGSCTFNTVNGTISDIRKGSEVFSWRDESGAAHQNINHYAYANIVLGRRTIPYSLRTPLRQVE